MTKINFENDWQKYTWRARQQIKSRYKSKPFYKKNKWRLRTQTDSLKKKTFFYKRKNLRNFNARLKPSLLFFHNSFIIKNPKNFHLFFNGILGNFEKIFDNFKAASPSLKLISIFKSISFSNFLSCYSTRNFNALIFSNFEKNTIKGWFFFVRLLLISNVSEIGNIFDMHYSKFIYNFFFSSYEKYYRLFFSSLRNRQWIIFVKKHYWSILTISQKLLFFSLSYLFSWKVLHGSSKKVWMSLSNSYCAFYFYKKDTVIFDSSKTIQSLKRAFYFLTSSIQNGSHTVFISWRFSEDFKNTFYNIVKSCCQSASYGWFGGVLTNIKKLGLFSNLYFKLSAPLSKNVLNHEWLKIPVLFDNSNLSYFSSFYDKLPISYHTGNFLSSVVNLHNKNLQFTYLNIFSNIKCLILACINFFCQYSFSQIFNVFNIIQKNTLKFFNNFILWFFFSKSESYFNFFTKAGLFKFHKKKWPLINTKKRLPLVIKKKKTHIKRAFLKKLPNLFKIIYKKRFSSKKHKKIFFKSKKKFKIRAMKSKLGKNIMTYRPYIKKSLTSSLKKIPLRLKFKNDFFFKYFMPLKRKKFFLNKFRPLKHARHKKKFVINASLVKRFIPVSFSLQKYILHYKKFKRRRRKYSKKKIFWKWRYFLKNNWSFFLFFKKNIKKWRKFRVKKKIKRWRFLKAKNFKPQYKKFNRSFKKFFKKLFPTTAILLNSSNLSMAQNDVINLKMPSIGILNSSNLNGYFNYCIPANDDNELSSLFYLNIFMASILKGQFFKRKLFFDNL